MLFDFHLKDRVSYLDSDIRCWWNKLAPRC